MANIHLYEEAMRAINELFDDKSVSQAQAYRNLDELAGEIEILTDSVDKNDEGDDAN